MTERREYAQQYKKLWKSLGNWLKNSTGWKVGGVAKEGTRRSGNFKNKSDLDIDFWISEQCMKQNVYDNIIPKLRSSYPGSQVQKGTSQNVIKFAYKGLKVEIILLPHEQFNEKVKKYQLDTI